MKGGADSIGLLDNRGVRIGEVYACYAVWWRGEFDRIGR